MSNEKIKYINSAQVAYDYFDFLKLYNEVNRLDTIIKFNYANFKQNLSKKRFSNEMKNDRQKVHEIDQITRVVLVLFSITYRDNLYSLT